MGDCGNFNKTINNINKDLHNLHKNKSISKNLLNCLKAKNDNKLGFPRMLPKLHKAKFGIRLIINCISHPTEKMCSFVDQFLKKIVSKLPTVLKDSQDLLLRLNSKKYYNIRNKIYLYSCDFESLYTNIDPVDATNKICKYLSDNELLSSKHLNIRAFKSILTLIFKNNVFQFQNSYFRQTIGLPMGCKCGPTIANIYLYIIEKDWVTNHSPLIYGRFIDDICYISEVELDEEQFQRHFIYLKLNIEKGDSINFLDLKISFDYLTNRFVTTLFTKPTNTFSYLLNSSNHPKHIFDNIPKSLLIRIRRTCSSNLDYLFESKKLLIQLLKRGYNYFHIKKITNSIGLLPQHNFLNYKIKNNNNNSIKTVNLFELFDNSMDFLKRSTINAFLKTKNFFKTKYKYLENISLKVNFSIGTNVGAYLIHGFKNKIKNFLFKCSKCEDSTCLCCNFIIDSSYIKINKFIFPCISNSTCSSFGVIYIIACKRCNKYYIGETKRTAFKRFSEHLKNIRSFRSNIDKSLINYEKCNETTIHFNCTKHVLNEDLQFFILVNSLSNDIIRRSKETDLINYFKTLKINILNSKIPDSKYITNLFFYR